jgi:hypothetical protein
LCCAGQPYWIAGTTAARVYLWSFAKSTFQIANGKRHVVIAVEVGSNVLILTGKMSVLDAFNSYMVSKILRMYGVI